MFSSWTVRLLIIMQIDMHLNYRNVFDIGSIIVLHRRMSLRRYCLDNKARETIDARSLHSKINVRLPQIAK